MEVDRALSVSCRTGVEIAIPHQNGDAISLPCLPIEFRACRSFNKCPVRIESIEPSSCCRQIEFWLQDLEGKVSNAAANAMASVGHAEIDVVAIKLAIGPLRKWHGFGPLRPPGSVVIPIRLSGRGQLQRGNEEVATTGAARLAGL